MAKLIFSALPWGPQNHFAPCLQTLRSLLTALIWSLALVCFWFPGSAWELHSDTAQQWVNWAVPL